MIWSILLPPGSTLPTLFLHTIKSTPRTLRTPRQRISILPCPPWELSSGSNTGRETSGNPPPQPEPTHLPLGLVEDAVHGVEQSHAPIELEHLLLGQLRTEAQTDMGQLGPERRRTRGLGVGGTVGEGGGLSHGDPRWG